MTPAEQRLVDVALLLAQELQEFVDDAVEASGDESSLQATQELLRDWEEAYAACGLTEEDHFQEARAAADRISPWRYPPEMPAECQRVLMTYCDETGSESMPITATYMENNRQYCHRIVRWMAIPEVECQH